MPSIRVAHFGLGPIGAAVAQEIAQRPGFKIVGAIDNDPAKAGRDIGDVAGLKGRIGIRVERDASRSTRTPMRPFRPATSPTSRPTFAGSLSMAPTILKPARPEISCATAAPMGPRPKCTTRLLGIRGEL